jgi:hypothetical protein
MKSMIRFSGAAAVALLLPACATVTRGTKETYIIESTPSAAEVTLSTGETCVTPCKLKLKRKEEFTARFAKAGYQSAEAQVESKFKGGGGVAAAGNVLIGGVIGAVLDGTNGSLMDLTPNPLRIKLIPAAEIFHAATASAPTVAATPAIEAVPLPQPSTAAPIIAVTPATSAAQLPAFVAAKAAPVAVPSAAPAYVPPVAAAPSGPLAGESCVDYAERLFPPHGGKSGLRTLVQERCEQRN